MTKHRKQGRKSEGEAVAETVDTRQVLMDLVIGAGVRVIESTLSESVRELCGERYGRRSPREPRRWGHQPGELVLGGRRVRVTRPRARQAGKELTIPAYAAFQGEDPLHERALEQMLVGVSTRKYRRSLEEFAGLEDWGTSKSAVSRRFVAETAKQLKTLLTKPLDGFEWTALMLDGLRFGPHLILVAMGIDVGGNKHVLGWWEGATENAALCRALLADLIGRGFPATRHLLVVMDGAKALRKAVDEVFADYARVQRCQAHKQRNVTDLLPKHKQAQVRAAMARAYRADSHQSALRQLHDLERSLAKEHPGAAASLKEGLEETLTVKRLGLDGALERSLATTNPIENLHSVTRAIAGRVKRCPNGDTAMRWVCAGVLEAERGFKRLKGYRSMPKLVITLHDLDTEKKMTALRKAG
jgi:transposase-like protein